ncbi:hypothetical protein QF041_001295 [Paenibacillus sp. W2I17]|nr:hypothetical protein [Paenibacillus sp. W2I17]
MGTYMIFSIIFVTLLMAFQANFYFDSVLGKSRRKPRAEGSISSFLSCFVIFIWFLPSLISFLLLLLCC